MKTLKILLLFFFIITTSYYSQEDRVIHFSNNRELHSEISDNEAKQNYSFSKENNISAINNYEVSITSNDLMRFIWVVNKDEQIYTSGFSNNYSFSVSDSLIAILIFFHFTDSSEPNNKTFFYEQYLIKSDTIINIKKENSTQKVVFNLKRFDNTELILDNFRFIFVHSSERFAIGYDEIDLLKYTDYRDFTLKFNKLPNKDFMYSEWLFIGKQDRNNGDFYYFEGELTNNFDTLYQNDLNDLEHAIFNYYFPQSQVPADPQPKVTFSPAGHSYATDPEYSYPLELSLYYQADTSDYLYANRFYNSINLGREDFDNLVTSQIKIVNGKVIGKVKSDSEMEFTISEAENTLFGCTPTYFFGKFQNTNDSIRIFAPWSVYSYPVGKYNQLYLSQTNDVVPQFPLNINIYSTTEQKIIKKVDLTLQSSDNGFYYVSFGYSREQLDFLVDPGKYKITIINDKGDLSGIPSIVTANCTIDLNLEDKNPPGLNSFQILSNNNISHVLFSDIQNKVRFMCEDENEISQIELSYSKDSTQYWLKLETELENNYYTALLPILETGNYSLKLYLVDNSGNSMEMVQQPAFIYENVTNVQILAEIPSALALYQNYPNPFNPSTTISYSIPNTSDIARSEETRQSDEITPVTSFPRNDNTRVTLKVFDILGRELSILVNEYQKPGNYSINFNADDLSSGVYYYQLIVGNFIQTKKMILLK